MVVFSYSSSSSSRCFVFQSWFSNLYIYLVFMLFRFVVFVLNDNVTELCRFNFNSEWFFFLEFCTISINVSLETVSIAVYFLRCWFFFIRRRCLIIIITFSTKWLQSRRQPLKNSSENRISTENLLHFFLHLLWMDGCAGVHGNESSRAFVVYTLGHGKVVLDRLLESLQI